MHLESSEGLKTKIHTLNIPVKAAETSLAINGKLWKKISKNEGKAYKWKKKKNDAEKDSS